MHTRDTFALPHGASVQLAAIYTLYSHEMNGMMQTSDAAKRTLGARFSAQRFRALGELSRVHATLLWCTQWVHYMCTVYVWFYIQTNEIIKFLLTRSSHIDRVMMTAQSHNLGSLLMCWLSPKITCYYQVNLLWHNGSDVCLENSVEQFGLNVQWSWCCSDEHNP